VVRTTIPSSKSWPWERWLEEKRLALMGRRARFRSLDALKASFERAGFRLMTVEPTAPGREETWLIAERPLDPA